MGGQKNLLVFCHNDYFHIARISRRRVLERRRCYIDSKNTLLGYRIALSIDFTHRG